jgi:hypothetical protein
MKKKSHEEEKKRRSERKGAPFVAPLLLVSAGAPGESDLDATVARNVASAVR